MVNWSTRDKIKKKKKKKKKKGGSKWTVFLLQIRGWRVFDQNGLIRVWTRNRADCRDGCGWGSG